MKRTAVCILTAMFSIGTIAAVFAADSGPEFKDVKRSDWFYPAVQATAGKEIIAGYPDGTFLPDRTVTYGEFLKMAVVAAGENPGAAQKPSHWAKGYYDKGLELGFYTRNDINLAYLDEKIPRKVMALIIASAIGEDGKVAGFDELQAGITDVNAKTKYQYDIVKAYGSGVLSGYPDKTFRPDGNLNRAEAASVIQRLVDESERLVPGAAAVSGAAVTATESGVVVPDEGTMKEYTIPYSIGDVTTPVAKTGPIKDMIENPERINDIDWGAGYKPKTKYVLAASTKPFEFRIKHGLIKGHEEEVIGVGKGLGRIVLIKDGRIVKYVAGQSWEGYCSFTFNDDTTEYGKMLTKIPEFDYLGSFDASSFGDEYMLIVPNPWK